ADLAVIENFAEKDDVGIAESVGIVLQTVEKSAQHRESVEVGGEQTELMERGTQAEIVLGIEQQKIAGSVALGPETHPIDRLLHRKRRQD
ncbi:hypothetical protein COS33_01735, partial [Candidatus Wolfebacteria bacterium CG02_land_8_20_14_3_00_37_12]